MACLRAAVKRVNGAVEHSVGVAFAEDTTSAVLKALLAAAARVIDDAPRNAATRVDAPHAGTVGANASSEATRRPGSTSPRGG